MHKVWPDSLKINMRFNFPLFLQINWATPLSIPWGRILQVSSLKLWRHYKWWWLFLWKFWQFLPQGLPKNAWMVMKLCENLKPSKIHIIYDNEHYYNKWLFRKATKITFFFQPSSKKVNFHWRFIHWRSRNRKNLIANF